jgi:hypothetical protein
MVTYLTPSQQLGLNVSEQLTLPYLQVDLRTHTLRAVVVEETVPLIPFGVPTMRPRVVKADIGDGYIVGIPSIEVTAVGAAANHSKTIWESFDDTRLARTS